MGEGIKINFGEPLANSGTIHGECKGFLAGNIGGDGFNKINNMFGEGFMNKSATASVTESLDKVAPLIGDSSTLGGLSVSGGKGIDINRTITLGGGTIGGFGKGRTEKEGAGR